MPRGRPACPATVGHAHWPPSRCSMALLLSAARRPRAYLVPAECPRASVPGSPPLRPGGCCCLPWAASSAWQALGRLVLRDALLPPGSSRAPAQGAVAWRCPLRAPGSAQRAAPPLGPEVRCSPPRARLPQAGFLRVVPLSCHPAWPSGVVTLRQTAWTWGWGHSLVLGEPAGSLEGQGEGGGLLGKSWPGRVIGHCCHHVDLGPSVLPPLISQLCRGTLALSLLREAWPG